MYCDEQDKSIFKLREVYEAIRIDIQNLSYRGTFTVMCGNFGTKTKDVETVNTVGVRKGNSNLFHFYVTGGQQSQLF